MERRADEYQVAKFYFLWWAKQALRTYGHVNLSSSVWLDHIPKLFIPMPMGNKNDQ